MASGNPCRIYLINRSNRISSSCKNNRKCLRRTGNCLQLGEYIDPDVLDIFEEETGIQVIYEEIRTNEIMYPKILSGAIAYDVVCPSDYMIQTYA